MNAAGLFRRIALLQVLLALGAFAVADRNEWFFIAGGVLTVASSYITEGPRGKHLPNWIVGPGVILAVVWGGFNFARHMEPSAVGSIVGAVVLAILMLKLYGRKGPSDWRQILALTVVVVVDAALNSMELLAGLLVMMYAGVAIYSAMLQQMYSGALRVETERAVVQGIPLEQLRQRGSGTPLATAIPIAGRHGARHLRRLLLVSVGTGLLLSVIVFVLFPREPAPGRGWGPGGRQAGFSAEMRLRAGDRINRGSREVFTVRMLDPQGAPTQFAGPLHLRGAVLDHYSISEDTWSEGRSRQSTSNLEVPGDGQFVAFSPEAAAEPINVWTQVVEMRSFASEYVFSMWLPLGIAFNDERNVGINTQSAVVRVFSPNRSGLPGRYSLRVQPFPGPQLVRSVCPSGGGNEVVSFPVPEVVKLARQLLASAAMEGLPTQEQAEDDPVARYERNRRVARWFSDYLRGPEFVYTTDLGRFVTRSDEDPNISFLSRYKFGHCEFFASALASLCRSVGVEARVVTGYAISEYDSMLELYVVRESNAHAWVEVRTGEWQWSTFDPSPAVQLLEAQNANRSWLDQFRWLFDPLEFAWQSRVVNFDAGSQTELADRARAAIESSLRGVADWLSDAAAQVNRAFRLGPAGYIWLGLVGVMLTVAVVAAWVLMRRDRMVRTRLGETHSRALTRALLGRDAGFYLDALDVLRRHGVEKPQWRTPKAHAQALAAEGSAGAEVFAAIVERFYAVRYAGKRPGRNRRNADAALVASLRSSLGRYKA